MHWKNRHRSLWIKMQELHRYVYVFLEKQLCVYSDRYLDLGPPPQRGCVYLTFASCPHRADHPSADKKLSALTCCHATTPTFAMVISHDVALKGRSIFIPQGSWWAVLNISVWPWSGLHYRTLCCMAIRIWYQEKDFNNKSDDIYQK